MEQHVYSFFSVDELGDNLFALRINEGVEISAKHLAETSKTIFQLNNKQPFALLIERVNSYSFSSEALLSLEEYPHTIAMGVWVPNQSMWEIAKVHEWFHKDKRYPLRLFHDRTLAITWLKQTMNAIADPQKVLNEQAPNSQEPGE